MSQPSTRKFSAPVAISAQAATTRTYIDVSDYVNLTFQVTYDASFAGTVRVYGSLQSAQPDVSAALSQSNEFFDLATARHDTAAIVAGATGYTVVAASVGIISADVQYNLVKWVCIEVVRTAGTYDMTYMKCNNG